MHRLLRDVGRTTAVPLLFAPFSGSLAGQDRAGAVAFTGSGAVRYLPAQGARINFAANPSLETGALGWFAVTNAAAARSQVQAYAGTWSYEIVANGAGDASVTFGAGTSADSAMAQGAVYTFSAWVYATAGAVGKTFSLQVNESGGAAGDGQIGGGVVTAVLLAGWQRVAKTGSIVGTGRRYLYGVFRLLAPANGNTIYLDAVQSERGATATAYFDGTTPGAAWLDPLTGVPGTAHNSPSVSAAAVLVEEATTNQAKNPRAETATTGYSTTAAGTVMTRDTAYAYVGTASLKNVCDATLTNQGFAQSPATTEGAPAAQGQTWTASVWLRGSGTVFLRLRESDSGGATVASANGSPLTLTDQWQRIAFTYTTTQATCAFLTMGVVTTSAQAATFWATNIQLEQKAYATTYCDGALGTGYTWSGAAHASSSSRVAGRLTLTEAGHGDANRGAAYYWLYRESPVPSGAEANFSIGDKAAGVDLLEMRINNPSTQGNIVFYANNDAGTFLGSAVMATVPPATWHLAGCEWDGRNFAALIDAVGAAWTQHGVGAGTFASASLDLNVGSNRTGVVIGGSRYGPLFVFDRPLTAYERQKLCALGPAAAFDSVKSYPPI